MKTKVLSYILLAVALGLGYYLYRGIVGPMEEKERVEKIEKKVIEKLKMIREAQKAYYKTKTTYADTWDKLIAFVDTGVIYNIQIREQIFPRPDRPWLGDSVAFINDTLEMLKVKPTLFPEIDYSNFDPKSLPNIPGSDKQFELYAGKIELGGVTVDVIEVKDIDPVDKTRKEDNQKLNRRPLRFGSKDEVTTGGNWE